MKTKSLLSAIVLASASLVAHSAYAADISNPPEAIELVDDAAFFGALFEGNNAGNTFTDRYDFTTSIAGALTADLFSGSGNARNGLDITGFGLYGASGLILDGTQLSTGRLDEWTLTADGLAAGTYYVQVTGSVMSNAAGKYNASVALAPVPEPETYGMMLGGLGLLGFAARRRKGKSEQA
jgi:hypothetical protein